MKLFAVCVAVFAPTLVTAFRKKPKPSIDSEELIEAELEVSHEARNQRSASSLAGVQQVASKHKKAAMPEMTTRRRSVYESSGCNSNADIGGSEWFYSCEHSNMHASGRRRATGICRCDAGFQQGPDGVVNDTAVSALIKPHEICIPCGCLNVAKNQGFSLDLCPITYPNSFLSTAFHIRDNLILPTLAQANETWHKIQQQVSSKFTALKTWISHAINTSVAAMKQFTETSLLEVREIHAAALLQVQVSDLGVWDDIESTVMSAYTAVKTWVNQTTVSALDEAKAAWGAAKLRSAQLASAAKAVANALPQKFQDLLTLTRHEASQLYQGAKTHLADISEFISQQYNSFINMISGALSFDNFNLQLVLSNPTAFFGELSSLDARLDYIPDTEVGGGLHGSTDPLEDLVTLTIDHTIPLDAWSAIPIHVKDLLGSISINSQAIMSHGVMGFLEDVTKGKLKFGVTAKKLDLHLFGASVGWINNLAFHVLESVGFDVPLPENLTVKAAGAVDAYNYLTFQKVNALNSTTSENAHTELTAGTSSLKIEADNEGLALEIEVEDTEDLAEQAAKETAKSAKMFSHLLEEAGKEACKTISNRPCVFPFIFDGVTYNSCTNVDHDEPWCSTEVDSSGEHTMSNWDKCSAGCDVDLVDAKKLLVSTGNETVETAHSVKQTIVETSMGLLDSLRSATQELFDMFW